MGIQHLTQKEVARRWCLSPRTLERWRWLGQGPAFLKLGGRVAYRLEDIEAFEAAQTRDATNTPQSPHAGMPAAVTA
jgi:predicted site-specific integrase-resolvase